MIIRIIDRLKVIAYEFHRIMKDIYKIITFNVKWEDIKNKWHKWGQKK